MRADTSQNLTMDWDTVYAIPYRAVNEAIAASGSSPKSFSQPENDGEVVVSGDFGPWQLATGGSGKDIHMSIPILKGRVTSKGGEPVEFENITAEVEVRALYLPNPQTGLMDLRLQTSNEEGIPQRRCSNSTRSLRIRWCRSCCRWRSRAGCART